MFARIFLFALIFTVCACSNARDVTLGMQSWAFNSWNKGGGLFVVGPNPDKCSTNPQPPACGGLAAISLNGAQFYCKSTQFWDDHCRFSSINLDALGMPANEQPAFVDLIKAGKWLVGGRVTDFEDDPGTYQLVVDELWTVTYKKAVPAGQAYGVTLNTACSTPPCAGFNISELNLGYHHQLPRLDLVATGMTQEMAAQILKRMETQPIIVVGNERPAGFPPQKTLVADAIYMRRPSSCSIGRCGYRNYCDYPVGTCGADGGGVCLPRPDSCTRFEPVCGCDGKTYDSACDANQNFASVAHEGACASP